MHRTFQKLEPCDHHLSSEEMRLGEFNSSSQKAHAVTNDSSATFIPGRGYWALSFLLGLGVTRTTHNGGGLDIDLHHRQIEEHKESHAQPAFMTRGLPVGK